jgi:hypothetical protein
VRECPKTAVKSTAFGQSDDSGLLYLPKTRRFQAFFGAKRSAGPWKSIASALEPPLSAMPPVVFGDGQAVNPPLHRD